MNNNEHILRFDKIKQQWSALAMTAAAKEKISQDHPLYGRSCTFKTAKRNHTGSKND